MKAGHIFYLKIVQPEPYKCYVVGVVEKNMIVYKYYGRYKQKWHYVVESQEVLEMKINYNIDKK